MQVFVRHEEDTSSTLICDCEYDEIELVVGNFVRGGGIYVPHRNRIYTNLSYQYVLDRGNAYCDIILHEEES